MASREPPNSSLPPSMGPGARPLQPGERPGGSLLQEISAIRSHYGVHVENNAVNLSYQLKDQQRSYRLPFENIPVEGLSKSLCYSGSNGALMTGTLLIDLIRGCENVAGRQVSQTEAEGIAFYGTRRMMTMYVGQVVGISIGGFAAWRTRKEMKFPFMKPKAPEKYENFPARFLPLLRGNYARFMWQITRANIYLFLWIFVSNPFFRSIADTRMTVGLYADPRTHDLTTLIKGNFDRLRSNRAQEASNRVKGIQQSRPADGSPSLEDGSSQSFYGTSSPTTQDTFAADSSYTDGNTDTGLISDTTVSQRQIQDSSPNAWSKAQSRGSRSGYDQPSSKSSDFFFDDASPTAGNDPDMSTSQPYSRQNTAGAWDRLRRGGPSQSTRHMSNRAGSTQESPDFETKSDSFSFSPAEEEKRLAKEQAQKEFDAMLEKERNEGGNAEYQRDMRATEPGQESNPSNESAWSRRRRS